MIAPGRSGCKAWSPSPPLGLQGRFAGRTGLTRTEEPCRRGYLRADGSR